MAKIRREKKKVQTPKTFLRKNYGEELKEEYDRGWKGANDFSNKNIQDDIRFHKEYPNSGSLGMNKPKMDSKTKKWA